MAISCDILVGVGCVITVVIIIVCFFILPKKQSYKATLPLAGYNPQTFKKNPFKQSWMKQKGSTMPQIGFNTNRVALNTMPPTIPTPRQYFRRMKTGAAAALPTDVSTVGNALTHGSRAIANGQIRIPIGKMNNPLYKAWGSENLKGRRGNFVYTSKANTNLDSPSFQCGNFLPRNGGMKRAKEVCSETPGCIGFITDKNNIPICLKSSSEQQRFYNDKGVNFYEKNRV